MLDINLLLQEDRKYSISLKIEDYSSLICQRTVVALIEELRRVDDPLGDTG